jgi:hypothetical protein
MSNLRPRSPRWQRRWLALPLLLLALGVTPGAANEAAPPRPAPATRPAALPRDPAAQMARWFADLGHSDPRVREAARISLMGLPRKDLPKLERLVRDSVPLVPSQAVVLRDIVTHVFLSGEKYESSSGDGFLGVRPGEANLNFREPPLQDPLPEQIPFGPPSDPGAVCGVVIIERMPGFAGARSLQDGDVILSMVEQADLQIRVALQFTQVVKSAGAGKTVHFQILRQGQIVVVPVTLDARPDAAEFPQTTMQALLNDRKAAADEYWETTFAPLLKEGVS